MIQVCDTIWVGDSFDEKHANLSQPQSIGSILNVAHDLQPTRGCIYGFDYMQVGLIDGPGNPTAVYYAAILALATLQKRKDRTLVTCHTGSRSLAVSLKYMHTLTKTGWDGLLDLLYERVEDNIPVPHPAHRAAFDRLNWRIVEKLVRAEQ